jgi:hypothetical protein
MRVYVLEYVLYALARDRSVLSLTVTHTTALRSAVLAVQRAAARSREPLRSAFGSHARPQRAPYPGSR